MTGLRGAGVIVHGGAGDLPRDRVQDHVAGCLRAARAGAEVLRAGGSALDAAQRAVEVLEDDPRFNAGTGACLSHEGTLELDASIVDGHTLGVGAVCVLPAFQNPVAVARAVLAGGRHCLYAGEGARAFALAAGFTEADPVAMITPAARSRWHAVREGHAEPGWPGGTVGAVAFDGEHVAAATSTGGMVDKSAGRVGDSPIVGAGTAADDTAGGASATGHGEAILRVGLTWRVLEHLRCGRSPAAAAQEAVAAMEARVGGFGGVVVLGRDGTPGHARNTATMTWAYVSLEGREETGH